MHPAEAAHEPEEHLKRHPSRFLCSVKTLASTCHEVFHPEVTSFICDVMGDVRENGTAAYMVQDTHAHAACKVLVTESCVLVDKK